MVEPGTTRFQYLHGVSDPSLVAPETYTLHQHLLNQAGNAEIQLHLMKDYANNVTLYATFQAHFRQHQPPLLAVWGDKAPFFLPAGALAFNNDIPNAIVKFF